MLKNFFRKKGARQNVTDNAQKGKGAQQSSQNIADTLASMPGTPDISQMNMVQRFAWKQFQKMSPQKQREVMKKAMTPENIEKNKDQIIKQLEEMKAAGMMSDDQYRLAKRKLGLK